MSAEVLARGRLGQDPKSIQTKTAKPMARMSLAVSNGEETLWIGLIAFGRQAEHLMRYAKGDSVSVTGRLELNAWTTKECVQR